jgi:alkylresorcinol/alkylpyrone synthase
MVIMDFSATEAPSLLGIATAVPRYELRQDDVIARAQSYLPGVNKSALERLMPIYDNAGIERRFSCVPPEWYGEPHGWEEKNRLYIENAVDLIEEAATKAMAQSGISPEEIDLIVSVSTTGIATPSLDARLMERLPFRRECERLPIFGLGCAGGVLGLARSFQLAMGAQDKTVLLVAAELCGLTFRRNDASKANVVATALFGDGAAAAVVKQNGKGPKFEFSGEYSWSDSLDVMGWRVEDDGLGVVFSRDIPTLTRTEYKEVMESFLSSNRLSLADISRFVCHPGGAKVLDALEDAFGLARGGLESSRDVLRNYGNMSAVTVLFVLEKIVREERKGRYLLTSLGPGFTAAFMTMMA